LIFDKELKLKISQEVNIIINNAASVDFNLRLDLAIQINYYGPLRILEFAKTCSKLDCFTHVSTSYVADRL
jgi:fatty acyl-CoA reductase